MAREVDFKNPESWNDEDLDYLRERVDRVPAEHRHLLDVKPDVAPSSEAMHPAMARLDQFVRENWPERAGEDPVDVVIDLLTESYEVEDDDNTDQPSDKYDSMKISELRAEAMRRVPEAQLYEGDNANAKQPWIDALRRWDRENAS